MKDHGGTMTQFKNLLRSIFLSKKISMVVGLSILIGVGFQNCAKVQFAGSEQLNLASKSCSLTQADLLPYISKEVISGGQARAWSSPKVGDQVHFWLTNASVVDSATWQLMKMDAQNNPVAQGSSVRASGGNFPASEGLNVGSYLMRVTLSKSCENEKSFANFENQLKVSPLLFLGISQAFADGQSNSSVVIDIPFTVGDSSVNCSRSSGFLLTANDPKAAQENVHFVVQLPGGCANPNHTTQFDFGDVSTRTAPLNSDEIDHAYVNAGLYSSMAKLVFANDSTSKEVYKQVVITNAGSQLSCPTADDLFVSGARLTTTGALNTYRLENVPTGSCDLGIRSVVFNFGEGSPVQTTSLSAMKAWVPSTLPTVFNFSATVNYGSNKQKVIQFPVTVVGQITDCPLSGALLSGSTSAAVGSTLLHRVILPSCLLNSNFNSGSDITWEISTLPGPVRTDSAVGYSFQKTYSQVGLNQIKAHVKNTVVGEFDLYLNLNIYVRIETTTTSTTTTLPNVTTTTVPQVTTTSTTLRPTTTTIQNVTTTTQAPATTTTTLPNVTTTTQAPVTTTTLPVSWNACMNCADASVQNNWYKGKGRCGDNAGLDHWKADPNWQVNAEASYSTVCAGRPSAQCHDDILCGGHTYNMSSNTCTRKVGVSSSIGSCLYGNCSAGCPAVTTTTTTVPQTTTTTTIPRVVTCNPSSAVTSQVACGAGYNGGTKYKTTVITCPNGPYGQPSTTTSDYNTSGCYPCLNTSYSSFTPVCGANESPIPNSGQKTTTYSCATGSAVGTTVTTNSGTCTPNAVTCTPSTTNGPSVACGAGYNGGTKFTTTYVVCPTGSYGQPSTSTSGYNTSGCHACPGPSVQAFTPTCGVGQTPVADSGVRTTTYSCSSGAAVGTTVTTSAGTCNTTYVYNSWCEVDATTGKGTRFTNVTGVDGFHQPGCFMDATNDPSASLQFYQTGARVVSRANGLLNVCMTGTSTSGVPASSCVGVQFDTPAPTCAITSAPPATVWNTQAVSVGYTSTNASKVQIRCAANGGAMGGWGDLPAIGTQTWAANTLGAGSYTCEMQAVKQGNSAVTVSCQPGSMNVTVKDPNCAAGTSVGTLKCAKICQGMDIGIRYIEGVLINAVSNGGYTNQANVRTTLPGTHFHPTVNRYAFTCSNSNLVYLSGNNGWCEYHVDQVGVDAECDAATLCMREPSDPSCPTYDYGGGG